MLRAFHILRLKIYISKNLIVAYFLAFIFLAYISGSNHSLLTYLKWLICITNISLIDVGHLNGR